MTDAHRRRLLRAWAAWNDRALEMHGTQDAIHARINANDLADTLGEFTESDWGVIRNAQREYLEEAGA